MADKVPDYPILPVTPASPDNHALFAFNSNLSRELYRALALIARRANDSLQKDGTEPMLGDLNMGGFAVINAGGTSSFQPLDSDLTAIAALATTSFGRALLALADEAAFKASLNLEAGTDFITPAAVAAGYQPLTAWEENLVVNGAMQHSQENGNTASGATAYYIADEFQEHYTTSTGVLSFQRVQSVTPKGSTDRIRASVTTADTSIAAGEYLFFTQKIEGYKLAHLGWGTASAKPLIVRFGFKGPAGTYAVAVRNNGSARSYVQTFVVANGNDAEYTLVFPGDTSGTWLKDNGQGLELSVTLACGSTYQTTANAWQAGNFISTSAVSNGLGLNTNVFELFDVGAYADMNSTGLAPPWKMPDWEEELYRCRRYWELGGMTFVAAAPPYNNTVFWKAYKRVAPTLAIVTGAPGTGTIGNLTYTPLDGVRQLASTAAVDILFSGNARM